MKKNPPIIPGLPHHVWTRGNNRRRIFSRNEDYQRYLWQLARALAHFGPALVVHALCLMSNHLHLLATPLTKNVLSDFMKFINQRYAQMRNEAKNGSGKLFEQGFEREPVTDERYLATVTMYIDANPTRAGLRRDSYAYPWSMAPLHLGDPATSKVHPALWTPNSWYLGLGKTPEERARGYQVAFADYLGDPVLPRHVVERKVIERVEALSVDNYQQRLRRPDGSSAREPASWQWGEFSKRFRGDEG